MTNPKLEAIEAAARALAGVAPEQWEQSPTHLKDSCRWSAEVALTAAAPILEAHAKAEALREAADERARLKAIGKRPYDDCTKEDLADFKPYKFMNDEEWLIARAATIEEGN